MSPSARLGLSLGFVGLAVAIAIYVAQEYGLRLAPRVLVGLTVAAAVFFASGVMLLARPVLGWVGGRIRGWRKKPKAVAYPKTLRMTFNRATEQIQVSCGVAFYALRPVVPSPSDLVIRTPDGQHVICELHGQGMPANIERRRWSILGFFGDIDLSSSAALRTAIQSTMNGLPTQGSVFVEVEIIVPGGSVGMAHARSGVRFGPEPGISGPNTSTAKIFNWDGVPATWRGLSPSEPPAKTRMFRCQGFDWELQPMFLLQHSQLPPDDYSFVNMSMQGPLCTKEDCRRNVTQELLAGSQQCICGTPFSGLDIPIQAENNPKIMSSANCDRMWPLRRFVYREAQADERRR